MLQVLTCTVEIDAADNQVATRQKEIKSAHHQQGLQLPTATRLLPAHYAA